MGRIRWTVILLGIAGVVHLTSRPASVDPYGGGALERAESTARDAPPLEVAPPRLLGRWTANALAPDDGTDDGSAEELSLSDLRSALERLGSIRLETVVWEAANLDRVARDLWSRARIDVRITACVRCEMFEEATTDFCGDDVSVRTLLDIVTEPSGLGWTVERHGVVTIRCASELPAPSLRLRYFDVRDLGVAWHPPGAEDAGADGEARGTTTKGTPPRVEVEEVVAAIRANVGRAGAWARPASLDCRNAIVIARNEPDVLEDLQRFLDDARARGATFRWTPEEPPAGG